MRLSENHFRSVASKIASYYAFGDITREYCRTFGELGRYGDKEHKAKKFVRLLDEMNDLSCRYHGSTWYGKNPDPTYVPQPYDLGSLSNAPKLNCFGMLKALQCIEYNIELEEIPASWIGMGKMTEYEKALGTLRKAIEEIKGRIIDNMPEYESAKWAIGD